MNTFKGEGLLKVIAPIFGLLVAGLFLYLGFFEPSSDVYADLHPTSVFDIVGLILLGAFMVLTTMSQIFKIEIWTSVDTKFLGIAGWVGGFIGILLIHFL